MSKLPPEIKEKWISALRSGKYKQAYGELHVKEEGYCCLGVLAEVLEPGITDTDHELANMCTLRSNRNGRLFVKRNGIGALFAPNEGLHARAVALRSNVEVSADISLMTLNDEGRWNFFDIADAIEKYL